MRRFYLVAVAVALLAVVVVPGIILAYNCVNTILADSYWGTGSGGHWSDANLGCQYCAGLKYKCPDPSKYPVNHTAEVGAIMVLEPNKCGGDPACGHVGIVVGVGSGSIQVYEEGWKPTSDSSGAPGTFTHTYPCDGMWFIHRDDTVPPAPPPILAVLGVDGKVWAKQGGLSADWVFERGEAQAIALDGNRIVVLGEDGGIAAKEGLFGEWVFLAGETTQIAAGGNRVAMVKEDGGVQVKEGMYGEWVFVIGEAKAVALSGNRIAVLLRDGRVFAKDGIYGEWVYEVGEAQAIALDGDRMGVLRTDGGLIAKEGLYGEWVYLTGGVKATSFGGNLIAALYPNRGLSGKDGMYDEWTFLSGEVCAVAVAGNWIATVREDTGVAAKEGISGDWIFETGNARQVALAMNGTSSASDLSDIDCDNVPNDIDNCSALYNPDQADTDDDGAGDVCDVSPPTPTPTPTATPTPAPTPVPTPSATPIPTAEPTPSLSEASGAGSSSIEVGDNSELAIGDHILINPGMANEEENQVVGFGSILLAWPLQFDHEPGEPVMKISPASKLAEWSNKCYVGAEQPVDQALANIIADVQAVYRLGAGQTFDRWFAGRPEVSNITTIRPYESLFVLMAKDAAWPQTPSSTPPTSANLAQGWNNVCYAGTAKAPEDATSGIADELAILYTLGSDQAWGHYVPGRPEASNIPQLNQYDSVLVLVTQEGGATWTFNP
jgi:surface antigen